MPTAYTAGIEDGTITTAQQFLMLCAREFGACVSMRNEPLSKPIPERFMPDYEWYNEKIEEERKNIEYFQKMSLDKVRIYREQQRKEEADYLERAKESAERILHQYQDILAQVESWIPPTPEHNRLKEFAIEQITMCLPDLSFYSVKPDDTTDEQWLEENIKYCKESIERYKKRIDEEIKATESRTAWVKALRDSF